MPGVLVPLFPEPAFSVLRVEGNQRKPEGNSQAPLRITYRLSRDSTITSAYLVFSNGERRPMEIVGDQIVLEDTNDLTLGTYAIDLAVSQRDFGRVYNFQFDYLQEPRTGGALTITGPLKLGGLRKQEEQFRFAGGLDIVVPVEFRQSGSLDITPTFPVEFRSAGNLQANQYVTFSQAGIRLPASHYLQVLREDEELVLLGVI